MAGRPGARKAELHPAERPACMAGRPGARNACPAPQNAHTAQRDAPPHTQQDGASTQQAQPNSAAASS